MQKCKFIFSLHFASKTYAKPQFRNIESSTQNFSLPARMEFHILQVGKGCKTIFLSLKKKKKALKVV